MKIKQRVRNVWAQLGEAPLRVKVVVVLGVLYLVNPVDLIPDFIPFIGHLDDIIVVSLVTKYVKKHLPDFTL